MSGLNATKRERKLRYLRGLRGEKKGVSPVVATLILILIAVAAAAALYLWLVAWQGNITGGIGQPGAQTTFSIGGSTSMYQFDQLAVTWFEQNNSDIAISNNGGGTGAGLLAVCGGHIDVAAATTPETAALLQANDGCPSTPGITITTIAYDAVDVVIQGANTHGLLSLNYDTLGVIYNQGSTSAPNIPVSGTSTIDGTTIASILTAGSAGYTAIPAQGTEFEWAWLPAAVQGAAFPGIGVATDSPEAATTAPTGAGVACTGAAYVHDICATGGPGTGTPCGFTVCASGAAPIVPVERADAAGATLTFEAKLLGYTASNKVATTFAGLGYSGCGSNNLLADCGIVLPAAQTISQDPGVQNYVASNPNAIGYGSDGLARATSGIGAAGIVPFDAVGQVGALPQVTGSNFAYGAVVPTTGSTGTISAGIVASTTVNNYAGWRPFTFVTLQPPTGEVQRFIQFVTDPANNAALAAATYEVGLYQL